MTVVLAENMASFSFGWRIAGSQEAQEPYLYHSYLQIFYHLLFNAIVYAPVLCIPQIYNDKIRM